MIFIRYFIKIKTPKYSHHLWEINCAKWTLDYFKIHGWWWFVFIPAIYSHNWLGYKTQVFLKITFGLIIFYRSLIKLIFYYRLAIQATKAVNYLHSQDSPILHRDIKSLNFLVSKSGGLKLTDFGMAKAKSMASASGSVFGGKINH